MRCIDSERVRDPLEDDALVLRFCDGHACHLELVTPLPKSGEELSNIATFRVVHVEEGLMQVGLYILALCCKEDANDIPLLFHGRVLLHVHGHFIWETLAQETLCNSVIAVLLLALQFLGVCGVVRVLRNRPSVRTIKIAPTAS